MGIYDRTETVNQKLTSTHKVFPHDFVQSVFVRWYDLGKPMAEPLWESLRSTNAEMCPSVKMLHRWINDQFIVKGIELDQKVADKMDTTLVENKLEMLERHADMGRQMQVMAMDYLEKNGVGSSRNAITLLVKGLEAEREARSVPSFLKDLSKKTDMELVEELKALIPSTNTNIIDADVESID